MTLMLRFVLAVVTLNVCWQLLSAQTLPDSSVATLDLYQPATSDSLNSVLTNPEQLAIINNQSNSVLPTQTAIASPKFVESPNIADVPEPSLFAVLGIAVAIGAWQILRYKPATKVVEE
jgi:hypothetical protein